MSLGLYQETDVSNALVILDPEYCPGCFQSLLPSLKKGTGIDPEISPRLFSKFATKSHKGTGLGLYISKNIIEAHDGRLYASNNYDRGATFTITLPLFMKQK